MDHRVSYTVNGLVRESRWQGLEACEEEGFNYLLSGNFIAIKDRGGQVIHTTESLQRLKDKTKRPNG